MFMQAAELRVLTPDQRTEIEAYLRKLPAGTQAAAHLWTLLAAVTLAEREYAANEGYWLAVMDTPLPDTYAPVKTLGELYERLTLRGAYAG